MVVVGVAVQVVAVDSQSAGHHHALDGAPAPVLDDGSAAVVSMRFPGEQRSRDRETHINLCLVQCWHLIQSYRKTQPSVRGMSSKENKMRK